MSTPDHLSPPKSPVPIEVSLALDGRLNETQAEDFTRHLASYPKLRRDFAHFEEARNLVRAGALLADLPEGFDVRLSERIRGEELKRSVRTHARARFGPERWWSRAAIGVGGAAAGVAIMFSLNALVPALGPSDGEANAANNSSGVVLAPNQRVAMGGDDVAALVNLKYRGFREFVRQTSMGSTFDPLWVKAEMSCNGLLEDGEGLLSTIAASGNAELEVFSPFVKSLDIFSHQLAQEADFAAAQGRALPRESVEAMLSAVQMPQASAFWRSDDLARRAIGAVRNRQSRATSETEELEQYIIARSLFARGEFRNAADAALYFISNYPESAHLDRMGAFAARSLICIGDATAAARLVESLSRCHAHMLGLFSSDELERMRESTPELFVPGRRSTGPEIRVTVLGPDGARQVCDQIGAARNASRTGNTLGARNVTSEDQIEFLERLKAAEAAKRAGE